MLLLRGVSHPIPTFLLCQGFPGEKTRPAQAWGAALHRYPLQDYHLWHWHKRWFSIKKLR